jgi:uncharacterized protein (DUF1697 family)
MAIHIGLLRAVNLGSHNKVGMADLKELLGALGFKDARSLLQSGNLVFDSGAKKGAALEALLEAEAKKRLGLDTDFFVRTASEWQALIADNPFPEEAKRDPGHLVALCCKEAPTPAGVAALQAAIKGREVVRAKRRQAYLVYPDGIGNSRLTAAVIEKHLGTVGTGRNWNTVLKLGALVGA